MADTSNFNVRAVIPDPEVRDAVYTHVKNSFLPPGTFVYNDTNDDGAVELGASDISLGDAEECFDSLLKLIENGISEWECTVCHGEGKIADGSTCLRCAGDCYYDLAVPDFAFVVYDEPKFEWMGSIRMHAPGLPDFSGDCDADGNVRVDHSAVLDLVDKITGEEEDLPGAVAEMRREIAALTGRDHVAVIYPRENT